MKTVCVHRYENVSDYVSRDDIEAAIREFLATWDEDYLCGCGLSDYLGSCQVERP